MGAHLRRPRARYDLGDVTALRCFISAGHQERPFTKPDDPGTEVDGIREDELAWAIADELALALRLVQPQLVPQTTLAERVAWVNVWSRPGDVCLEVHLNSGPPAAYGCETFHAPGSQTGRQFAAELHASLVKLGRSPRGVKPDTASARKRLAWLRNTRPWAALVEVAFLTNDLERAWLLDGGVEAAGHALAAAVDNWP